MQVKTSELTGPALDWAVAKCEGLSLHKDALLNGIQMDGWHAAGYYMDPNAWIRLGRLLYSTDWAKGGPIIEREGITISKEDGCWSAYFRDKLFEDDGSEHWSVGESPLIAAMRCFVSSKLGDTVEVPDELV